jgi:signal transduction histidine kinase
LISNDQIVGTLHFNSQNPDAYTEVDVALASRIGLQIAGAVTNSLMFVAQQKAERMLAQINEGLETTVIERTQEISKVNESLRDSQNDLRALGARMEMIREEERTHISHEIHDEIGQALTGLKFDISWIGRRMAGVGDTEVREAVTQRISSIFADIDSNIELVRNLSTRLRPAALDNFGLSAAIESEVLEFEEKTGIRCEISTPDSEIEIDKDTALGVFRILQEAMTNAARHAKPTSIIVDLEQDSKHIILRVKDDGKGMEKISDTSSLGLLGMKERAILMGGDLVIESAPNKGTTVSLRAPIQGRGKYNG